MKTIWLIIGIFLTFTSVSSAYDTAKVLLIADSYSYVREKTNSNDAPEITEFLKYVSLPPALPYCLAFDVFIWGQVHKPNPYPKLGGTVRFWEYANQHPLRYKIYGKKELTLGRGKEMEAGIGIYFYNSRSGHAFLFDQQVDQFTFKTIEGNTVGKTTKNAAEQRGEAKTKSKQGVYHRIRDCRPSTGMIFKGIVVPR